MNPESHASLGHHQCKCQLAHPLEAFDMVSSAFEKIDEQLTALSLNSAIIALN
jgi:hypothetical protein